MLKNLREYLTSVFQRDPAARSVLELLTVYPGVHALVFHRLSHRLWSWHLRWLARLLATLPVRCYATQDFHPENSTEHGEAEPSRQHHTGSRPFADRIGIAHA